MIKRLFAFVERTEIGKKALRSGRFRTLLFACGSLCFNLAYALFNGIYGIAEASYWFLTLFAYYAILAVMRFYAITFAFRENDKHTEYSVMRFCGLCLCFLAVTLSGVVCLTIATERNSARHMIVMIAVAAYTFFKATMAVIRIVQARKKRQPLLITLRNIGCADAVMSMVILEHSMLSTFGSAADSLTKTMDIATGAGAFLIVLALGLGMAVRGRKAV